MQINANFDKTARCLPETFEWVPSPAAGVERVMLDRIGDEVAVATSLVRYAPGATFERHEHSGGEEFLVLEGEFGDEKGRYPAGTYVRNPIGTAHVPFSEPGCTIFVKLRQFDAGDQQQSTQKLALNTPSRSWMTTMLHDNQGECVQWIQAAADVAIALPASIYMQELLVFDGAIHLRDDVGCSMGRHAWYRQIPGDPLRVHTEKPSLLWVKTRPRFDLTAKG